MCKRNKGKFSAWSALRPGRIDSVTVNIMRTPKKLETLLTAGIFCGCAATLISSVWVVLFWAVPARAFNHWYEAPRAIGVTSLYAAIPAGAFGFLCGIVGSLYLGFRGRNIASGPRLLVESAVMGARLSVLFPLCLRALGWGSDWLNVKAFLFCVAVGCPVSILYAALFRKSILAERPAPTESYE
jgi:hypothetical protein